MSVYYASDAVQSITGIELFEDLAVLLRKCWHIVCRIARIISLIIASIIGGAVPILLLYIVILIYIGD